METILHITILLSYLQWDGVAELTAYTPSIEETWGDPHTTASGMQVQNGIIACPRTYSFGTIVQFEGIGTFQCWDRGGAIKENRFDIFMWNKTEALKFGRKKEVRFRVINI